MGIKQYIDGDSVEGGGGGVIDIEHVCSEEHHANVVMNSQWQEDGSCLARLM